MIVSGSGPGVKVMHGGAGSGRHPGPVDVRGAKAAPVPEKGETSPSPLSNQRQSLAPMKCQNGARTEKFKRSCHPERIPLRSVPAMPGMMGATPK
jgi:hypothetical protein